MSSSPAFLESGLEACPGFHLTSRLGVGGFGEVWEGVSSDGQRLAFKFIGCNHKHASVVANEIRLLVRLRDLSHPHIIKLFTVLTRAQYIIVAMERADGGLHDLYNEYVHEHGEPLPAPFLVELMAQAASALDYLAAQKLNDNAQNGFQHCDVKPSNLLLVGETLKVADFGLCGPMSASPSKSTRRGTPRYSAPELLEGRVTERTDQYSLAITYCELRTGKIPFARANRLGDSDTADLTGMEEKEKLVILRALDRRWLNRWPNCREFVNALAAAIRAEGLLADPAPARVAATIAQKSSSKHQALGARP